MLDCDEKGNESPLRLGHRSLVSQPHGARRSISRSQSILSMLEPRKVTILYKRYQLKTPKMITTRRRSLATEHHAYYLKATTRSSADDTDIARTSSKLCLAGNSTPVGGALNEVLHVAGNEIDVNNQKETMMDAMTLSTHVQVG